jgi:16S rRNA G966 N2-methylase RsmD
MLSELFPSTIYSKIQYDTEGLYSITQHDDADMISEMLINNFTNKSNLTILDGTGGLGGNTISFSKYFKTVTSVEINENRYKMLINNIKLYNIQNVNIIIGDSIEYLLNNYKNYDIYFFDPPWGGPEYKKHKNIKLKISNYYLSELATIITNSIQDKLLVFKIPYNYDLNEFSNFNYKLYKLKKYYIILILI